MLFIIVFFFFQAEDGIRDGHVTGVQTCALPIFQVISPILKVTAISKQSRRHRAAPLGMFMYKACIGGFTNRRGVEQKRLYLGALDFLIQHYWRSEERRVGIERTYWR